MDSKQLKTKTTRAVHYRPAGGMPLCTAGMYEAEVALKGENPQPRVTSDVRKVTCRMCLGRVISICEEQVKAVKKGSL